MNLFRRKSRSADAVSAGDARVTRRLTKELARAESLATMLATSRAAAVVEVADYLAGIYIYDWERLSKYWDNHEAIDSFLQRICQISPQRWHRWIEFYDKERRAEDQPSAGRLFGSATNDAQDAKPLGQSGELQSILRSAEEIAPHHDTIDGRSTPILTSECILFCIAKSGDSEIGRRLRETGLDVTRLEQAARNPRHAPLHGGNAD